MLKRYERTRGYGEEVTVPALTVETTSLNESHQLLLLTNPHSPLVWLRKGQGMIGVGTALRFEFSGRNRIRDAAHMWKKITNAAHINDSIRKPGTGLVAFGVFSFSPSSAQKSVLIIPEIIVGHRNNVSWITRIRLTSDPSDRDVNVQTQIKPHPLGAKYQLSLRPGAMSPNAFKKAVTEAINRIHRGDLNKVVLARDLIGHTPENGDIRHVLSTLAQHYPNCWTYCVDNLIGCSPETLIRVNNGTVNARVLAGTTSRGATPETDHAQAIALATNHKEQDEHEFAVQSVRAALTPHSSSLSTSEAPFTLKLPNLWHLATDFDGQLTDESTSLDLIAALHPTAAVAGTPTPEALTIIDELEPFDRGRYAGPIGWVDANGDGEWAITLRCAQISDNGHVTAYAGAGIVAESNPEQEFLETRMKFSPIIEALSAKTERINEREIHVNGAPRSG